MNDIDQKIQAALRRDGAGANIIEEPNLAEEVFTAFRGRHRFISTFAFLLTFALFAAAVWSGWRFYAADAVDAQIQWAALTLLFMIMVGFLKIWFWLEMHTNRVLRELKRVELLLVTRRSE
jgi:FtsH-binding integral membrane protein